MGPIHSDKSKAAIAGFVGTLRQMGAQGDDQAAKLADYIESSNPLNGSTGDKMASVVKTMVGRVQDRWHNELDPAINPDLRQRPEYQQASQQVQSLSNLTGTGQNPRNKGSIFGGPQTGVANNGSFTNPGAQGGATAAPAPQPQAQPAAQPFSPMPTPTGTVNLPGNGMQQPPQGPPQFNPALRQPFGGQ